MAAWLPNALEPGHDPRAGGQRRVRLQAVGHRGDCPAVVLVHEALEQEAVRRWVVPLDSPRMLIRGTVAGCNERVAVPAGCTRTEVAIRAETRRIGRVGDG